MSFHGNPVAKVTLLCSLFLGTSWSLATAADNSAMAGLIGNTLIQTGDSWEHHTWYNPDSVYYSSGYWTVNGVTGMGGDDGTYAVESGQLCQMSKLPNKPRVCGLPGLNHKLGDKWDGKTADGKPEHYEIAQGHQ